MGSSGAPFCITSTMDPISFHEQFIEGLKDLKLNYLTKTLGVP